MHPLNSMDLWKYKWDKDVIIAVVIIVCSFHRVVDGLNMYSFPHLVHHSSVGRVLQCEGIG